MLRGTNTPNVTPNVPKGGVRVLPIGPVQQAPVRTTQQKIVTPAPQTTASMQTKLRVPSSTLTAKPRPLPAIPSQKTTVATQNTTVIQTQQQTFTAHQPKIVTTPVAVVPVTAMPVTKPIIQTLPTAPIDPNKRILISPELIIDLNHGKPCFSDLNSSFDTITAAFARHPGAVALIDEVIKMGSVTIVFKPSKEVGAFGYWNNDDRIIAIADNRATYSVADTILFELCNAANKEILDLHQNYLSYEDSYQYALEHEKREFKTIQRHAQLMKDAITKYMWVAANKYPPAEKFDLQSIQIPKTAHHGLSHYQVIAANHNQVKLWVARESEKRETNPSKKKMIADEIVKRKLFVEKMIFFKQAGLPEKSINDKETPSAEKKIHKKTIKKAIETYNTSHLFLTNRQAIFGNNATDIETKFEKFAPKNMKKKK